MQQQNLNIWHLFSIFMTVNIFLWAATILDHRNRAGIPEPKDLDFREIFDLDYICQQLGGEQLGMIRLPFGPYTAGQLQDHAESLYMVKDALIHNEVRGHHPEWRTSIFSAVPEHEAVKRFESYYGKKPTVGRTDALLPVF